METLSKMQSQEQFSEETKMIVHAIVHAEMDYEPSQVGDTSFSDVKVQRPIRSQMTTNFDQISEIPDGISWKVMSKNVEDFIISKEPESDDTESADDWISISSTETKKRSPELQRRKVQRICCKNAKVKQLNFGGKISNKTKIQHLIKSQTEKNYSVSKKKNRIDDFTSLQFSPTYVNGQPTKQHVYNSNI